MISHGRECQQRDNWGTRPRLQGGETRSLLRWLIDQLAESQDTFANRPHHSIRLNRAFRSDITWWPSFVVEWSSVGIFSRAQADCVLCHSSQMHQARGDVALGGKPISFSYYGMPGPVLPPSRSKNLSPSRWPLQCCGASGGADLSHAVVIIRPWYQRIHPGLAATQK